MEKLDLDNKILTIGKTTINSGNLKGLTKDEFLKTYPKILGNVDLKEAWNTIKPFTTEKPKPKKSK